MDNFTPKRNQKEVLTKIKKWCGLCVVLLCARPERVYLPCAKIGGKMFKKIQAHVKVQGEGARSFHSSMSCGFLSVFSLSSRKQHMHPKISRAKLAQISKL
jgi:hypothetical protein